MRRHDLDWIRVSVFALLIIYHCGMFFVPWDWHIKNDITISELRWPMIFVNQWRLATLFLISGMGTRLALSKRTRGQYISERFKRLLIPLIFGIIFIVPPQVYIERLISGYNHGFLHFWMNDFFTKGVYPAGNFSWHHLWFLPYLLLFSIVLAPLFMYLRNSPKSSFITKQKQKLTRTSYYLYIYCIPLFLIELIIEPFFDVTHALIDDWFTIALFITIFFYGFNFISIGQQFWKAVDEIKFRALLIGILSFGLYFWIRHQEDGLLIHCLEAAIKNNQFLELDDGDFWFCCEVSE